MDFLKKAASSMGNKDEKKQDGNQQQGGDQNQQKDDYVDKAFGMASKKAGYNMDRETQEKFTDQGRAFYEKSTGSKVSDKVSN